LVCPPHKTLKMKKIVFFLCIHSSFCFGQGYTSYFTGNITDKITNSGGGICLMGGASENDNAMKWFLQKANGGDVLVLRTSGSNGYNNYMYASLGIKVNSVETIVIHNRSASNDPYIKQKIQQAEAIWIAGGDQWTYVSFWRNTSIDSLINLAIKQNNIVIGGTSAGMAILGNYYFSAQYGTVTSENALANPFLNSITIDTNKFIRIAYLRNTITDTHFDNPDRKGRLMTFLAKLVIENKLSRAIACDEYTAVCIDTSGIANIYGSYPSYDDNAYFIQSNCSLTNQSPEICVPGYPLTWYREGQAVKTYRIKGTTSGSNTFNLKDWKTGVGGTWLDWSIFNGVFTEQSGAPVNCVALSVNDNDFNSNFIIYPNPSTDRIFLISEKYNFSSCKFNIFNAIGQQMKISFGYHSLNQIIINLESFENGVYYLQIIEQDKKPVTRTFIKNK
jgi:cyanophycinase-like exopeptidase